MLVLFVYLGVASSALVQPAAPVNLRVNRLVNPTVDISTPTLSWEPPLINVPRGTRAVQYEVQVSLDSAFADLVYDSGPQVSNASAITLSVDRSWEPDTRYYWRVRWMASSTPAKSPWASSTFTFGLPNVSDWHNATWIACGPGTNVDTAAAGHVRVEFAVETAQIRRATLYLACIGWCEAFFNGKKLGGDNKLEPGWTQWNQRIEYVAYDVNADAVAAGRAGSNALGIWLGNGWPGHLGLQPAAKVLLSLEANDGKKQFVTSSSASWLSASGPVVSNDIYLGENYDARLERPGWDSAAFNASGWVPTTSPTKNAIIAGAALTARPNEPIRALQLLPAQSIDFVREPGRTPGAAGEYVADCGQNIAGWSRIEMSVPGGCPRGTNITLRHAEYRSADGTLYVGNLRRAKATDVYTCKGGDDAVETYEPRFTYHGFRYIGISGWPGTAGPLVSQISCRVVHSGVEDRGEFFVGDGSTGTHGWRLINQLQSNVRWTQLDNLHSVPTDCPQRDERQGWMADASVSSEEAMHNFGMGSFYVKWLTDMLDVQLTPSNEFHDCSAKNPIGADCNGTVTDTTPHVPGLFGNRPADPSWGMALPLVSYFHWRYYFDGNVDEVRRHLSAVKHYIDWQSRVAAANDDKLVLFHWYGDWLEPQKVPSDERVSEMMSAFNFAFGLRIARDMSLWIGDVEDANALAKRFNNAAAAFNRKFFNETSGLYGSGSQAEQVPALFLEIAPNITVDTAIADALITDIVRTRDSHLNTGIITTKWLFPALSRLRRPDVGLALLLQRTDPSWGFMVSKNATTVWEHWNAYNNPSGDGMSSHNHPAFASVGAWLYTAVAGIKLDDTLDASTFMPAYRRIVLEPELLDYPPLASASARVHSPSGDVALAWRLEHANMGTDMERDSADDDIGAGWRLVRRVAAGNVWHPAIDQLSGTAVYDDHSGTFSRAFDDADFDEFLFATGDMQKWLITKRGEIQRNPTSAEFGGRIIRSSISPSAYSAKWYHRAEVSNPEDPWVSLIDHENAIQSGDILYGEAGFGGSQANTTLPVHGGASVYIRKSTNVVLRLNTTVPIGAAAELRLAPFAAVNADNMLVRDSDSMGYVWRDGAFVPGASAGISGGTVNAAGAVCLQLGSGSYAFDIFVQDSK